MHSKQYELYVETMKKKANSRQSQLRKDQKKPESSQSKITFFVKVTNACEGYKSNHPKQNQFVENLILTIACDQLPLVILESPSFRKLLLDADPK